MNPAVILDPANWPAIAVGLVLVVAVAGFIRVRVAAAGGSDLVALELVKAQVAALCLSAGVPLVVFAATTQSLLDHPASVRSVGPDSGRFGGLEPEQILRMADAQTYADTGGLSSDPGFLLQNAMYGLGISGMERFPLGALRAIQIDAVRMPTPVLRTIDPILPALFNDLSHHGEMFVGDVASATLTSAHSGLADVALTSSGQTASSSLVQVAALNKPTLPALTPNVSTPNVTTPPPPVVEPVPPPQSPEPFPPVVTPLPSAGAAVPEPASWAMMIAGFGLIGTALRRRARPLRA